MEISCNSQILTKEDIISFNVNTDLISRLCKVRTDLLFEGYCYPTRETISFAGKPLKSKILIDNETSKKYQVIAERIRYGKTGFIREIVYVTLNKTSTNNTLTFTFGKPYFNINEEDEKWLMEISKNRLRYTLIGVEE